MDIETYLRFLLVLVFVLGLIGGFAWLARRFGLATRTPANRGSKRRLAIVEVASLDARRKLVLVQRDDREHLLVLGQTGETVIETGIAAPQGGEFADTLAQETRS